MKKRALLAGGLHKARPLADMLIEKGYRVTVINNDYGDCLIMAENDSVTVINGDGTLPFILEEANARDADIAIACTEMDADNLIICELCKKQFHVKKTIVLMEDPKKTEFFCQMGIDSVVCVTSVIASNFD
ncbi:hypothetical protein SDC9_110944 [bioreactor metagenome]|uniref:RCK N-terminal domain-containing protein n=1 Tax=bioreactor metagenome TaxID=1076179 RepID=A0A645BG68_9ZZZZ|nr:NAD-binding protein [Dehalobacterium formicoaceticum]